MKPQLPDSFCIWRLAEEIDAAVKGGTVRRIVPAGQATAVMEVACEGQRAGLLLCWRPGMGRVHLVEETNIGERSGFVEGLARRLEGAVVLAVQQQAFDRVVIVKLANLGNMGPEARGELVIEAAGRQANCLLLDADGVIVAVARPTPAREGLYRALAVGEVYKPPPGQDKADPRVVGPEVVEEGAGQWEKDAASLLRRKLQGISPTMIAELACRSGVDLNAHVDNLGEGWAERVWDALREMIEEAQRPGGWLHRGPSGEPLVAYPVKLRHMLERGAAAEEISTLSEGVEKVAEHAEERARIESLRGRVTAELRREIKRKERLIDKRRGELTEAQEAGKWRRWAELLLANLHTLQQAPPGGVVRVVDYYDPEQREVEVPLVDGKGPKETAEIYFQRHRRLRRAAEKLPELLDEAEKEVEELRGLLQRAEASSSLEELEAIAKSLGGTGKPKQAAEAAESSLVGQTKAPTGHVVLFGKSAKGNDEIVRLARPQDLWLHARGVKGAHVLIRLQQGEEVPREALLFAARLAGRLSDYRRDGVADVDYTRARYVRKPRGSPPGFVTYTHQKTVTVDLGDGA